MNKLILYSIIVFGSVIYVLGFFTLSETRFGYTSEYFLAGMLFMYIGVNELRIAKIKKEVYK